MKGFASAFAREKQPEISGLFKLAHTDNFVPFARLAFAST
jgi:hypothetical protein